MITLLALRARRRSGFIVGSLGVALVFVIYLIWVPR
jgi:flagellar biogenesis protein FliO